MFFKNILDKLNEFQKILDSYNKKSYEGQIISVIGKKESIKHEIHNIEQSKRVLKRELQNTLEELHQKEVELQKTKENLKHIDRLSNIGLISAGIIHDLKNPTNLITNNLEMLNEYFNDIIKITKTNDSQNNENLAFICNDFQKLITACKDASQRLNQLIECLRMQSRKNDTNTETINLNDIIDSNITLTSNLLNKNKIKIHKNLEKIPNINANKTEISQAITNLIVNAIQAIKNSGNIWIKTKFLENKIHIVIKDDGIGISEDKLDKIFELFYTTKDQISGTGLGLSNVKSIIQSLGGSIEVDSNVNVGTRFRIELPLSK